MNVVLNYNDATGKWEVAGTVSGQFICVPKLNENTNFKFSNVNLACNTDKSHKANFAHTLKLNGKSTHLVEHLPSQEHR